jgi:hypothetical protein
LLHDPIPVSAINDAVTKPVAKLIDRMIQKSARLRPADMAQVIVEIDRVRAALGRGFSEDDKGGVRQWLRRVFQGG